MRRIQRLEPWMLASALALCFAPCPAWAATTEVSPGDDVEAAWNALGPGDELVLHGGTYDVTAAGRFSVDVTGTAAMPIVVRAADGEQPVIQRTDEVQNIIDFDGATYLVIRGIEFVGGSAGLRFSAGDHVTIEDCEVRDTGDVALRANDGGVVYESFQILRNHIHHTAATGEGMYLGCNDNGCQFRNALIEGNYVHHTNGPTVTQGDGIEIKEGSSGNTVRDNVIHDTGYPCILTYSTRGNGPANVLERNLLFRCGDHAIQSAQDATIRNNIILGAVGDGIAMQPHQAGVPQNLTVVHNTIVHPSGDCISVRSAAGLVVVANNALYSQSGQAFFTNSGGMVTFEGNVGTGSVSGASGTLGAGNLATDFVAASFSGGVPNDVFPRPGSALVGTGVASYVPTDDFNGVARAGVPDVGAYAFNAAGNPGWTLAEDFKGRTPTPPDADADVTPDGGGDDGGEVFAEASDGVRPDADAALPPADDGGSGAGASDSGCGCRITGAPASSGGHGFPPAWLAQLGVLGLVLARTRRPRRTRARSQERHRG
jgi:MYXO-CTERM domain-containing protein